METTLGRICSFYSGTGFPVEYQGKKAGEYPFYKVGDISKNVVSGNVELKLCDNYIDWEDVKNIHGTIVPAGTIVFAKIGEAVKLNRRAITSNDCLVDNNVIGVKPNIHLITLQYCYHFLSTIKMEKYAESTTVPSVKKSVLEKIPIFLPSIEEQNAICSELNKVSELISLRKKQLQKLDDLVKSRFVEMFAKHNERIVPLKTICIKGPQNGFYRKGAEINGTIPIMKMKQLFGNESMSEAHDCDLVALTKTELERFLLTQNDLLFGRRSLVVEGAGKCRRVGRITTQAVFESSMLRVTLDATKVKPRYLQIWFNSEEGKNAISSIRAVTTIAGIKGSDLANVEVPVAPIALQEEFLEFVGQCDRSKLTIQKSLDKLELLKQSLMQTYFGDK